MYPKVPPVGYDTLVGVPIPLELHTVTVGGNHGWYYPFTIIIVSNIKEINNQTINIYMNNIKLKKVM